METSAHRVIAIDGPAASGKSTVARIVAEKLGWVFVNSGNLYRAATLVALRAGADVKDSQAVVDAFNSATVTAVVEGGHSVVKINGVDEEGHFKSEEVNAAVSHVSLVAEVREKLVGILRSLAGSYDVVVEGRDIGSVVFPNASQKFYIDASEKIRAMRRGLQGESDSIAERDRIDTTRKVAPLMAASDAIIIDSSHLSLEQVVEKVMDSLQTQGAGAADI